MLPGKWGQQQMGRGWHGEGMLSAGHGYQECDLGKDKEGHMVQFGAPP